MELGPLSIKKWDAGEKNGEIGQFLAELVFWLSCKISFFTISNHTNGAAEFPPLLRGTPNLRPITSQKRQKVPKKEGRKISGLS